jgi:glyoxylase-like metal-dependent hydrolase (beta-lactamase superfamily II)
VGGQGGAVGVHRWQVGGVTIVRVDSTAFPLPTERLVPAWAVPHLAPSTGEYHLAFSGFGIVDGDTRVVVDPWLADDNPRDAPDAAERVAGLLASLADAGVPADEVDVVVDTHIDGTGWNTRPEGGGWVPTFPNARYVLPGAELDAVARGEDVFGAAGWAPLLDAGLVDRVDASARAEPVPIAPHVSLHPAPGHNAGHVVVHVEDGGELAIVPGHLFLDVVQVADTSSRPGDGPEAPDTRRRMLELLAERRGLLLSPFFGGEGAGRVEGDAAGGFRLAPAGA